MTDADPDLVETPPEARPGGSVAQPGRGSAIGLLLVVALLDVLGLGLIILADDAVGPGLRILSAIGVAGALGITLFVTAGLSQDRPWARAAAIGVLSILALTGAIDLVSGLGKNRLTIPVLAIVALLVIRLLRRPAGAPLGTATSPTIAMDRRTVGILVGSFAVVALVWSPMVDWLVTSGNSPLAVAADSVDVSVSLDCVALTRAVANGTDATAVPIPATMSWHWTRHELLAGGTDSLAIRWTLVLPDGNDPGDGAIYLASAPGYHSTGSSSTLDASPGGPFSVGLSTGQTTLADQLLHQEDVGASAGFPVAIDVGQQRLQDDRFEFNLQAGGDPPAHGTLTVEGFYVHRNAWSAGPGAASCSW
jgi:hypothetical protein